MEEITEETEIAEFFFTTELTEITEKTTNKMLFFPVFSVNSVVKKALESLRCEWRASSHRRDNKDPL